ncbi:hypothetical protein [Bradyrhizobium sp. S69]|uniref:hypothetical protein n=1 Tax=Bradyrhizobium sp. S69 TaxID=1641856 RepID=UPI00131C754A|nr:hypothetical protein [Bradyrhizobium sp. S69]
MSKPHPDVTPKLIERFLAREETALPDIYLPMADGAVLAGEDLPGADSCSLASDDKYAWARTCDDNAFQRWTQRGELIEVVKFGEYWFINLSDGPFPEEKYQALVFAFDRLPICTGSAAQAMQLAEHCYPDPRPPVAGCWADIRVLLRSGNQMVYRKVQR